MKAGITMIAMAVVSNASAGEAVQTDWSGGPGVPGPVTDWENTFYMGLDTECYSSPGFLTLDRDPLQEVIYSSFDGGWSICAADVDNDGDIDVIGAAMYDDEIACWINRSEVGGTWLKTTILSNFEGARAVCVGDLNNDGWIDVAGVAITDGKVAVCLNSGGISWYKVYLSTNYPGASSVHIGDIDGDGDNDVIASSMNESLVSWFENVDGTGSTWVEHTVDDSSHDIMSVHAADVDTDGDHDIFCAGSTGDNITWWENTDGSGGAWTEHCIDDDLSGARVIRSGDIDNDGDIDCAAVSIESGQIRWWENTDGTGGSWAAHVICDCLSSASALHLADIDGDGDTDAVASSRNSRKVRWYENLDGYGLQWTEHVVESSISEPTSVYAGDINGDGQMDILMTDFRYDEVSWWDLSFYKSTGYATSSILDMGEEPQWLAVDWSVTEPPGTETVLQFRTGKNPDNLGYWTNYVYEPCDLCDIVSPGDTLFQYRVRFFADDSCGTPVLDEFLVSWDPLGTRGGCPGGSFQIASNPVAGGKSAEFHVELSAAAGVTVRVFDVSGRVVDGYCGYMPEGSHTISLAPLPSGVYMAELIAGDFHSTRRFLVLR